MPKTSNTRKQRAKELLRQIETGPSSLRGEHGCDLESYELWMTTWIRNELIDLIPELRRSAAQKDQN